MIALSVLKTFKLVKKIYKAMTKYGLIGYSRNYCINFEHKIEMEKNKRNIFSNKKAINFEVFNFLSIFSQLWRIGTLLSESYVRKYTIVRISVLKNKNPLRKISFVCLLFY